MKNIVIMILLALGCAVAYAQQPASHQDVRPLKVGDTVPDFKFADIFNGDRATATIADFKGQLLILDFGNTGCGACIESLPHMDSLRRQFGKDLQIFWVTYEPRSRIKAFWEHSTFTRHNGIATVVGDQVARVYFKHKSWPHEVWIYKGIVVAITEPEYVDAAHIRTVLSGQEIDWPVKDESVTLNTHQTPLFSVKINGPGRSSQVTYTALGSYREVVNENNQTTGFGIVRDTLNHTIRTFALNREVYQLYKISWEYLSKKKPLLTPFPHSVNPNDVVWEVGDSLRYHYQKSAGYREDWVRKYGICFESLRPDSGQTDSVVFRSLIDDLDHMLRLHVAVQRRHEKILALVKVNPATSFKMAAGIPAERRLYVNSIAWILNQSAANPCVYDETGYQGDGAIELDRSLWFDINAVRKAMARYGLVFREEMRESDKLVFGSKGKVVW